MVEKEFRVEFDLTGQGHYVIADNCIAAIDQFAKPVKSSKRASFVMCELWKEDGKRVGEESVFKEVKKPVWL